MIANPYRVTDNNTTFEPLGDLVKIRNGRNYRHLSPGHVPVYGSGGIMTYVNDFTYDKPSILIPRKGSLSNIFYTEGPIWNVDTIFYTELGPKINPRYLYHYLKSLNLSQFNNAGGVPSMTQKTLNSIRIPVPNLVEQGRIADILDTFAELEAELEARKKQYTFYREKLLAPQD